MKNILSKLKQNWLFILISIIFLSFFLINMNVVYFGDDYYYLTFKDLNFFDYFSKLFGHYQNDNGRFIIHMLVTIFLKFPLPIWAALNSIFLTGICYFASKIISGKEQEKTPLLCSIIFCFLAILDISITRQSVFWLTGSFNYVYPLFLFFAYWFCLNKIHDKKFLILSIFLGFLSASTMEQSAMMTFGLTILTFLSHFKGFKLIKKFFKENIKLLILTLVTLVGLSTVIFAPSQFKRIELENAKETEEISTLEKVVENTEMILIEYTLSKNILPYCILFNLLVIAFSLKKGTSKDIYIFPILALINIGSTLFNVHFFISPSIPGMIKYTLVALTLLTYCINFIYVNLKLYNSLINPLTISAILLIGSQLMMVVSPVLGPRNFIFGLVIFAFIISILANSFSYKNILLPTLMFAFVAILVNFKTATGYYKTRLIEEKNQELLSSYNSDVLQNEESKITLYKFLDDNYGWSMPYVSGYHEYWFKDLYEIKCKIDWINSDI